MKYVFIRDHRGAFPVDLMCRSLDVGRLSRQFFMKIMSKLGLLAPWETVFLV
jgi:hypothetical protein